MRKSFWVNLVGLGFLAGVALWVLGGLVFELTYSGRIYPGIVAAETKLDGMDINTATTALKKSLSETQVTVKRGTLEWVITADQAGAAYDYLQTAKIAYEVGRSEGLFFDMKKKLLLFTNKLEVNPEFYLAENQLEEVLTTVAEAINVPAQEPEIAIGTDGDSIEISTGEDGLRVDEQALKLLVINLFKTGRSGEVEVPIVHDKPKLTLIQVDIGKQRAATRLGKQIEVVFEEHKWIIDDRLAFAWMDLQNNSWKTKEIEQWVLGLAQMVNKPAQNAYLRFTTAGKVEEFKPATSGYEVDQEIVVEQILNKLDQTSEKQTESVVLTVIQKEPDVKNEEVNDLGIKELLARGESWFSGSIDNRIYNIRKAAEQMNGLLIAPGQSFSFIEHLGDVSASTGYKQAYIIKDGKTILGDGGGVCQVSSTLFRAALAAGLPIEERTAHAYRVHYYEERYQPGFDATIFQPKPDLKIKNDTQAYILIQTIFDEKKKYLSFELYGTHDGRVATISKARIWDVTAPPPDLYQDDPTLKIGVVKQTEHSAWGAKVAFDWKVTKNGELLQERTFYSNYRPWQAVYLRGTKPI